MLKCIADDNGYRVVFHKTSPPLIRIQNDKRTIDVWYSTGTVGEMKLKPNGYRLKGTSKRNMTLTDITHYL